MDSPAALGRRGEWGAKPRESVTVKPERDKSGHLVDPLSPPEPEAERFFQTFRGKSVLVRPACRFSDGGLFLCPDGLWRIQFLRD